MIIAVGLKADGCWEASTCGRFLVPVGVVGSFVTNGRFSVSKKTTLFCFVRYLVVFIYGAAIELMS